VTGTGGEGGAGGAVSHPAGGVAGEVTVGGVVDECLPYAGDLPRGWAESLDPPPDVSAARFIEGVRLSMIGDWWGVATTPWVPEYAVFFRFTEDGHYSARCIYQEPADCPCRALYYGTDLEDPLKVWSLDTTDGVTANGLIDIIYWYPPDAAYESGHQGYLADVELDATGDRLRFDFMYDEYGPSLRARASLGGPGRGRRASARVEIWAGGSGSAMGSPTATRSAARSMGSDTDLDLDAGWEDPSEPGPAAPPPPGPIRSLAPDPRDFEDLDAAWEPSPRTGAGPLGGAAAAPGARSSPTAPPAPLRQRGAVRGAPVASARPPAVTKKELRQLERERKTHARLRARERKAERKAERRAQLAAEQRERSARAQAAARARAERQAQRREEAARARLAREASRRAQQDAARRASARPHAERSPSEAPPLPRLSRAEPARVRRASASLPRPRRGAATPERDRGPDAPSAPSPLPRRRAPRSARATS
jgi:hypothetical protein